MTGIDIETIAARTRLLLSNAKGPLAVSVAYYLGAEAAFLIGTLSDKMFAPFWPPNSVLFCALALLPYQRWPLYVMAVFPAHVIAELGVGMGWPQLVVAFVTNCMVAVFGAFGLRYLLGAPPWFHGLRSAIAYVLIAIVCSPGLAFLEAMVRRQCAREPYTERGATHLDGERPRLVGFQVAPAAHRSLVSHHRLVGRFRHCLPGELDRRVQLFSRLAVLTLAFRHLGRCAFSDERRERGHSCRDHSFHLEHAVWSDRVRRRGC